MLSLTKIIYYLNDLGWSLWELDGMASLWALYDMDSLWALNGMASRILLLSNIYFPHPPNIFVIFTLTYLRPDSSDRRLTFYVSFGGGSLVLLPLPPHTPMPPLLLPSCLPPPIWLPLTTLHTVLLPWACPLYLQLRLPPPHCICPSWWRGGWGVALIPEPPFTPLTLLTADLLPLSVMLGGNWFCYLGPLAHLWILRPAVSFCPGGGEGGRVLIPGPPRELPTLMSLYVLVGRDGVVTRSPSCTHDSATVFVLPVKANSPRGFQPKFHPYNPGPPTCARPAMISAATVTPPRGQS